MKIAEVGILFVACFLFLLGRPLLEKRTQNLTQQEQRQEEVAQEEVYQDERELRVVFKARTPEEEPIADILWLNRAAGLALERGTPYFNITSQSIRKRFVESQGMDLSVIEGTIELQRDSMESDYDANEISSLSVHELAE